MALIIRLARASDAPDIARLTAQLGYESPELAIAERLAVILARPDQYLLVAEWHGRPVGWMHAEVAEYLETGPFVVIAGLVVDRTHRRQRIGTKLMEQAEEWARTQGCASTSGN